MILINFNNRNDNFGDQLISYLPFQELNHSNEVHFIGTKPEIVASPPLRIRDALTKIISCRIKGEKVILIDPPCARVHIKNLPLPLLKDRIIAWLLQKLSSEKYVLGVSIDSRIPPEDFSDYTAIGVRDNASRSHISRYHKNVFFTPDMACLMPPQTQYKIGNRNIVSFRKDIPDDNYSSDYSEKLLIYLPFIFELLAANKTNTFFYSQVDEDYAYNSKLSLNILGEVNIQTVDKSQDKPPYNKLFVDCGYVISNRLHVLLPAMIEGTLAIALISRSHKKIIDLLTSYGLDKTIVYLDSKEIVEKSIQEIIADRDNILKTQYETLQQLHNQLKHSIQSITNH